MTDFTRVNEKKVFSKVKPYGFSGAYCPLPYEWLKKYKKVKVIPITAKEERDEA